MSELKDGDLAMVRAVGSDREPSVARFNNDRCSSTGNPAEDCDPECCLLWQYFGTEWTDRPSQVEVVRRLRVTDCE